MFAIIFNRAKTTMYSLQATSRPGKYQHRLGGTLAKGGWKVRHGKAPIQLLLDLDTSDPKLAGMANGLRRLPLVNAFQFPDVIFGYRVVAEGIIEVVAQAPKKSKDFPYARYPESFPEFSMSLKKADFDIHKMRDLTVFGGMFGSQLLTTLSEKERQKLRRKLVEQVEELDLGGEDPCGQTLEDLFKEHCTPLIQGPSDFACSQRGCRKQSAELEVLCLIQSEADDLEEQGFSLWGDGDGEDIQLLFERCTNCGAIYVTAQST
jgi:hypothetical protein